MDEKESTTDVKYDSPPDASELADIANRRKSVALNIVENPLKVSELRSVCHIEH